MHCDVSAARLLDAACANHARATYEKTLDVFAYNELLKQRYRYGQICTAPPASD